MSPVVRNGEGLGIADGDVMSFLDIHLAMERQIEAQIEAQRDEMFGPRHDRAPAVTEDQKYEMRVRAKRGKRHHHIWVRWEAWDDWGWNPHDRRSTLDVCDVPDCFAVHVQAVKS